VAFDVGDEVKLSEAQGHARAEVHRLPRHTRTPTSVAYQPSPLRFSLEPQQLECAELGQVTATADITVFEFAAASVAFHIDFRLSIAALRRLADSLKDPTPLVERARVVLQPLYEKLQPAIRAPQLSDVTEEYFVFQILPQETLLPAEKLLTEGSAWLTTLVRLDSDELSAAEIREALRHHMSYTPNDLVVVDWAAAVVVDRDCDELLETISFANLQLLELRFIDRRLDGRLEALNVSIRGASRRWLPFWRLHTRTLRMVGALKVEINEMLERNDKALKLIGDQYVARLYQSLSSRFHLEQWGQSIRQSLSLLESIYQVLSEQAATLRGELLEWIIILLIGFEIIMAFL
jgi:hypothetical protein